jgi:hypothetical protein
MTTASDIPVQEGPIEPLDEPVSPPSTEQQPVENRSRGRGCIMPAFWTVASILSLIVNLILIIVILVLASQLFTIKRLVGAELIGGLHSNFVKMDQASIATTITVSDTIYVSDTIPVVFDLPLKQETGVVLTKDAYIKQASVFLNGTSVPTDIILKKGTPLTIMLDMTVPVNQTIPVKLTVPVKLLVPVNIPLNQTELHEPFVGLRNVVEPYKDLLDQLPDSWQGLLCKAGIGTCP